MADNAGVRELLKGRDSLCAYYVAQRPKYELYRHHRIILEYCEALERNEFAEPNLMIFVPPQNGKSESASTVFPAWYMGRHPDHRLFLSSYSQELVNDFAGQVRDFVGSEYHRAIFPECVLDPDNMALHDFRTTAKGACRSAGRGGSITGRGANLYIIDDPEKDEKEARNETVQRDIRQWFNTVVMTRRAPGAHVMIIKTRWDVLDLAGWELAEHGSEWKVLELPALGIWQPDGTRIADELNGDPLWPERYPREWLEGMRNRLTRDNWLALYQQKPAREGEGRTFAEEWFQIYEPKPNYAECREAHGVILVDPAKGKKKQHDYTVMWVVALQGDRNFYFVDGVRAKLGQRERWEALKALHKRWQPNFKRLQVFYEELGLMSDIEYFNERMQEEGYRFYINRLGTTRANFKDDLIKDFGTGICKDKRVFFAHYIWTTTDGRRTNMTADFINQEWSRYPAVAHDDMLNCAAYVTDPRISQWFPNPAHNTSMAELYKHLRERRKGISPLGV